MRRVWFAGERMRRGGRGVEIEGEIKRNVSRVVGRGLIVLRRAMEREVFGVGNVWYVC